MAYPMQHARECRDKTDQWAASYRCPQEDHSWSSHPATWPVSTR
eukprot:gene1937-2267_t